MFRYYLKAWAESKSFCCYSKDRRNQFSTTPKKVGNKRYFYQLNRLTAEDRKFIDLVLGPVDGQLKRFHLEFVALTQRPFEIEDTLEDPDLPPEQRQKIECDLREVKINLIEKIHYLFEMNAIPLLASLRQYDGSFYSDCASCIDFLNYLNHQYFRTDNLRKKIIALPDMVPGHSFERTALIFNHIYATSAAASLYLDRERYKIAFLKNSTGAPLLTGDQPVINLLDPAGTDEVELYYPISPETAILLTCDNGKTDNTITELSDVEVESFNFLIFNRAADQVYSSDPVYLGDFVKAACHLAPS
ncbi:DUF4238 domain-containing protein [Acidithiobacillus sp. CV18-3]|nr:DUF4238 domain-containing protein [Acidithiobacillus sp. CV18-3]